MSKQPLLPIAVALMLGIVATQWVAFSAWVWLALLGLCLLATGLCFLFAKGNITLSVAIVLIAFALGGWRGAATSPHLNPSHYSHFADRYATLKLRLTSTPEPRGKTLCAQAEVLAVDGTASWGTITTYLMPDTTQPTLCYGDQLLLQAHADVQRHRVFAPMRRYVVVARDSTSLRARCERVRMHLLHRMRRCQLTNAGVAEALALGWRADVSKATTSSYRDAGIAHLLAVSGLHVGVVAFLVGCILRWVGYSRRGRIIRSGCQLLAVWSFTLLTGLAPSSLRAALMFSLFIVANISSRRTEKLNLLAAAAIAMLIANPMLIHYVGWQLSFSAMAGILLVLPLLNHIHHRVLSSAIITTAATLATLPVVLSTFHRLPIYFLISNVVIIPFTAILLCIDLLYVAFPTSLMANILDALLSAIAWCSTTIQRLPYAVVDDIKASPWLVAGIAILVVAVLLLPRILLQSQRRSHLPENPKHGLSQWLAEIR